MRRTVLEAEHTRRKIVDAAEECFREKGIVCTTLQMIAERAGCTRGAIYWHFTEKHDLLREVIERAPFVFFLEAETVSRSAKPFSGLHHCMLRGLEDVQRNIHLRNAIELAIFGSECPRELLGENSADKLLGLIHVAVLRGQACGEVKASTEAEILTPLIFYVFIGALRTGTLMPENNLLLSKSTDALNLVFDMVLERKRIDDES
ncbi:acrEF/envCD operon transcriptional regulator [Pectobacterium carotovorum subsp. carotovorum]|nr:TetR family transcriptional regulator [Pectobacterium carotovorum subsp. carotovorum]GKW14441.1 acrEF/envCD operon transcriptional regulator [Pectobacterium carotovorum subsp. carotovorum]